MKWRDEGAEGHEVTAHVPLVEVDEHSGISWVRRNHERVAASPRYPQILLWSVLFGLLSVNFTFTIFNVALVRIARDLGTTSNTLTWAITGPPAPTSDHQPITFERDSGGNTLNSSDQDAAVVHAPSMPDSSRAEMSSPAFGARTVKIEHSRAPDIPMR